MWMIPVAVVSRAGPWLARMGGPAVSRALAAVQKASGKTFGSITEMTTWVAQNPMNATIAFGSLASAGFAVSDLFDPDSKQDPEVRKAATELALQELTAINVRLDEVAGVSEELAGIGGDRQDLALLRDVLSWAKSHYGSDASAIRAHARHQAFMELTKGDVEMGYALLDI